MTTQIINWADQLAAQAAQAAASEKSSGGYYSLKSGVLSLGGVAIPDNQIAVIILDGVFENTLYEGRYDPNNLTPPSCFSFGRDEHKLTPHKDVEDAPAPACLGCPMNEWGSSPTGKGKACKNTRRLTLIDAGTVRNGEVSIFQDPQAYESAPLTYLKVPVTSTKEYSNFVKKIALSLSRPPHGIVTLIKLVPDPVTQFKVLFTPQMTLPSELLPVVMVRHQEAVTAADKFTHKREEEGDTHKPKTKTSSKY